MIECRPSGFQADDWWDWDSHTTYYSVDPVASDFDIYHFRIDGVVYTEFDDAFAAALTWEKLKA